MNISVQEHSACISARSTNEREAQRRQSLAQGHAGDRSCCCWFLSRTPPPHPLRPLQSASLRAGARASPHRRLSVIGSVWVSPRRRALSRESQGVRSAPRPQRPHGSACALLIRCAGASGSKGAAVGPALRPPRWLSALQKAQAPVLQDEEAPGSSPPQGRARGRSTPA